jgi:hypothetical protein
MVHPWMRLTLFVLVVAPAGCSDVGDRPELGQVTGTVTMDGEPFSGVIIMFKPDVGRAASAVVDENGNYELIYRYGVKGAKIGPNTVSFAWPTGESGIPIPARYAEKSELKEEVKPGKNRFDFNLVSK